MKENDHMREREGEGKRNKKEGGRLKEWELCVCHGRSCRWAKLESGKQVSLNASAIRHSRRRTCSNTPLPHYRPSQRTMPEAR